MCRPSAGRRRDWDADGYVLVPGLVAAPAREVMLARALGNADVAGGPHRGSVQRGSVVPDLVGVGPVVDLVGGLLGSGADIAGFRLVVAHPGGYGRLWHQEAVGTASDPGHQVEVGVWLALTGATLEGGCPWVLPGSHTGPLRAHGPDRRPRTTAGPDGPGTGGGQPTIDDLDTGGAVPVPMAPGDALVYDSHLVHRSTDNHSRGPAVALVLHCRRRVSARAATG